MASTSREARRGGRGRGRVGFAGKEPAASKSSDRLGPLLRMYSELNDERKARAFEYISRLHQLEQASGGTTPTDAIVRLATRSAPEQAATPTTPGPEQRLSHIEQQLQQLTSTLSPVHVPGDGRPGGCAPTDPLDTLVSSVFRPTAALQPQPLLPASAYAQPGSPYGGGEGSHVQRGGMQHFTVPSQQASPAQYGSWFTSAEHGGFGAGRWGAMPPAPQPPLPQPQPSQPLQYPGAQQVWQPPQPPQPQPPQPFSPMRGPPTPFAPPQPAALSSEVEHVRNLQRHHDIAGSEPAVSSTLPAPPAVARGNSSGSKQPPPFMTSLTAMHQGESMPELLLKERQRQEWLRELQLQVQSRQSEKAQAEAARKAEEAEEEARYQAQAAAAETQLRQQLSQRRK